MKKTLSISIVLCVAVTMHSQSSNKKAQAHEKVTLAPPPPTEAVWKAEPTSFFGVKFGAPLTASYTECAKDIGNPYEKYVFKPDGPGCFEVHDLTVTLEQISMFSPIVVKEVDGRVAKLSAHCLHEYAEANLQALVDKFGASTVLTHTIVQSRGGDSYPNTHAEWHGRDMWIRYDTVGSRVDKADIVVENAAYSQNLKDQEDATRKAAGKIF